MKLGSAYLSLTEFLQWALRVAAQRLNDYKSGLRWQLRLGSVASTSVTAGGGRGGRKKKPLRLASLQTEKLDLNSICYIGKSKYIPV